MMYNGCPFSRSARLSWCSNYAGTFQKSLEVKGSVAWLTDQKSCVFELAGFLPVRPWSYYWPTWWRQFFGTLMPGEDRRFCVFSPLFSCTHICTLIFHISSMNHRIFTNLNHWKLERTFFDFSFVFMRVVLLLMESATLLSRSSDVVQKGKNFRLGRFLGVITAIPGITLRTWAGEKKPDMGSGGGCSQWASGNGQNVP